MIEIHKRGLEKCILLGDTGVGKTTIINILTKSKFKSKSKDITKELTLYGTKWFYVYDTPGFKSIKSSNDNDKIFIHDLKTIFLVLKYETRYESMLKKYYELTALIPEEYEEKIVIMISHFDLALNPYEDSKMIFETLDETGSTPIILYSKYSDKEEMAYIMHTCMSRMSKNDFHLENSFFHSTFLNKNKKS
jgi:GTP-binding protein EngB required for normal cell division